MRRVFARIVDTTILAGCVSDGGDDHAWADLGQDSPCSPSPTTIAYYVDRKCRDDAQKRGWLVSLVIIALMTWAISLAFIALIAAVLDFGSIAGFLSGIELMIFVLALIGTAAFIVAGYKAVED